MQYEPYQPGNRNYKIPPPPNDRRSQGMAVAAIVLSVIAISTTCCFYISFICGTLGIIFALLSKGGELTMSPSARTSLIICVVAMCLTVTLTIASFATVIFRYGSLEAFWKAYTELINAYYAEMR